MTALDKIIRANRTQNGAALPSVCSAHPDVLTAALLLAEELDRPLLVEATSNQVNHQGGYTGMTPADFIAALRRRATTLGTDPDRLMFGGDHLGPQAWKDQPPENAMREARSMISAYVEAGFTKIHLDCSEGCAGEPATLTDAPAAARAAELAGVAEAAAADPSQLRYIIGTEVPPPGGARHDDEGIAPTPPERANATLIAHREAFAEAGQQAAFDRVRGLVVQPGLEFAPAHVDRFDISAPDHLSAVLEPWPDLCFEAHSTDYQYPQVFEELARRNFAILKVGPALTFAWREALYALSHIDQWLNGGNHISELAESVMTQSDGYWKSHYHGSSDHQRLMRHFGLADRIRYYWARPDLSTAVQQLRDRLNAARPPMPLVTQYLAEETVARAEALPLDFAGSLLVAHVQRALLPYYGKSC
ncbi:class II D-tagatose-bisphosphate aldolase non-catalytic subunit [Paracoccus seriniphilus]|uniref:Tagatose-bisphosphate aldolase noncatalytic subunit n=1 Tax=Paracoccus seriniphilus TaxID=184748 RepID=A0A239PTI7_9RHOB|nr:class II D-tagatose-bisphosphate aldolase, non-catalytic subunit [Paracoccus seriniphilus]WCR16465.1 class II D-tagatose-bisphosphate aldolase, non-catalytic subunit [Paracoccus seriniphilus]SNT73609.1 tagatose-bisphosphate aldolase noncatalytic subunit [Paracoccus seriniphilus]